MIKIKFVGQLLIYFLLLTMLSNCRATLSDKNQNNTFNSDNKEFIINITEKKDSEIIKELKKNIKNQIMNLALILNSKYQDLSYRKGWLNNKSLKESNLFKLLNRVGHGSNTKVLKDIQNHFMINKNYDLAYLAFVPLNTIKKLQDVMIKSKIREYFKLFYDIDPGSIKIFEKKDGFQFGKIAEIHISKSQQILRYYVKTHAGGLLKYTDKRTHAPVNPIEMFTYKVLEYSGFGPEVHFFYDNVHNVYIATKDVGSYSSNPSNKNFVKYFEDFLKPDKTDFKSKYKQSCDSIITGIMSANIIQKILNLTDVVNNDKNITFVKCDKKSSSNYWCLKILDFSNKWEEGYPDGTGLFYGLVVGNGQYNYLGQSNKVISFYLGTKNLFSRVEHAKNFDYNNMLTAIQKAEEFMIRYMKENPIFLFKNIKQKVFEHISSVKKITEDFERASKRANEEFPFFLKSYYIEDE